MNYSFSLNLTISGDDGFIAQYFSRKSLAAILLVAVLAVAVALRLIFFVGFAGGDPQDDGIYLNIVGNIINSGRIDHAEQARLVRDAETINPIHIFPSRLLFNYATAGAMTLFGINDHAAALFPMLCSLAAVVVVFMFGTMLSGYSCGLYAAFFIAVLPLDCLYATRIAPDVPVAFFILLSMYCFFRGITQNRRWLIFVAGISVALGYLVKSTSLIACIFIVAMAIVTRRGTVKIGPALLMFFSGLGLVLLLEGWYYHVAVGDFFMRSQLIQKVYKIKYAHEWKSFTRIIDLTWIVIKYPVNTVLQQSKTVFGIYLHRPELSYFGLSFYPLIFAIIWFVLRRIRQAGIVFSWLFLCFLFVEFGPLEIVFDRMPLLTYGLIEKQPRYLTLLLAPAALFFGLWMATLPSGLRRFIVIPVCIVIVISSLVCCAGNSRYFTDHTQDLREAARFLKSVTPKKIYSDWLAQVQLRFYAGNRLNDFGSINNLDKTALSRRVHDAYAVIGGARGAGVVAQAFEKEYQNLALSPPVHWIAVKTISGKKNVFRNRNLTVYYIP